RSVGAAIGTALVGAVLFSVLALAVPEAASVFTRIVQQGPAALSTLPHDRQTIIQAAIVHSFSMAFFTIALFAAAALALARSHPQRGFRGPHSILTPALSATRRHTGVSCAIRSASRSGGPPTISIPSFATIARSSGVLIAASISRLRRSMIPCGVPA